jgi:hypothetical protein
VSVAHDVHRPTQVGHPAADGLRHAEPAVPGGLLQPAGRDAGAGVPDGDGDGVRLVLDQQPGLPAAVPPGVVDRRCSGRRQLAGHRAGQQHRVCGRSEVQVGPARQQRAQVGRPDRRPDLQRGGRTGHSRRSAASCCAARPASSGSVVRRENSASACSTPSCTERDSRSRSAVAACSCTAWAYADSARRASETT